MMLYTVVWLCLVGAGAASKVLVVFPVPDRAHSDLGDALVRTLLAGGHEVTYVSVFPKKTTNLNLTYADISSVLTPQSANEKNHKSMLYSRQPAHHILKAGPQYAQYALHHEALKKLLYDPSVAFDAVIVDWFYSGLLAPYIEHFVEIPAYDAIFRTPMQLRKRLLPPYEAVAYNGSLLLVNSHPPLGQTLPLPQNTKLIGGHHIREPIKLLPKSLQAFMDNAKNGVIFMNLGNLQGKLPNQLKTQILDALSQLDRLVLWHLEDAVEYVPKNIRLLDRAPQLSILKHHNTELFITDGSLTSLMEAVHCGVPFVAVPSSGEQLVNVDLLVGRGLGRKVDVTKYLPWTLEGAIREILRDASYRTNMQRASSVFKRRITPSNSEFLYWVELVISTGGAAHLRSPAVAVPTLERYHVDLWILAALILWFLSKVVKVVQVHLKDLEKKNK
ncbi:hypothetical protein ABMA27_013669 [Loxostege sticticalis]|uniref:UDP-glucuronosyltransferase n=1 Tax=Loxostege sticticalis TaxID=481309 RepID=A0ABR3IB37_LOXSC